MKVFSGAKAPSHCFETISRYSFISITGWGLNVNRLSRPARVPCTMRTRSSTRKCLVTACRVSLVPAVSSAIEYRCPLHNFANSVKRVSSPRAAKTAAFARALLWVFADISLDILHLLFPSAVIPEEGLCPPLAGNLFKARFRHRQQSTAGCCVQSKLHQGRCLLRIIHLR